MPDAHEYKSLLKEAEQAVKVEDFGRANGRLREALRLQEATLGPLHPEVASTLNNLAVVCETIGLLDDAEECYLRAHDIASRTLPHTDPLVVTSRDNLKDFRAARERPAHDWPDIERVDPPASALPAPAPPVPALPPTALPPTVPTPRAPAPPATTPPVPASAAPARPAASPPPVERARPGRPAPERASRPGPPWPPVAPTSRSWSMPLLIVIALLVAVGMVVMMRSWRTPAPVEPADVVAGETPSSAPALPAPVPVDPPLSASPPEASPAAPSATPPAEPVPAPAPEPAQPSTTAPPENTPPVTMPAGVRVVTADVCASLSTEGVWRCQPLATPAAAGRAVFYTRIASPSAMRLQHRWYQGTTLRQTVPLSIAANPGAGYRTFSRLMVSRGAWRVELRAEDGSLLREVAFEVQ